MKSEVKPNKVQHKAAAPLGRANARPCARRYSAREAMRRLKEHVVNGAFMAVPFLLPFVLVPRFLDLSNADFSALLLGCWLVGVAMLVDWYYLKVTTTYTACFKWAFFCVVLAVASLGLELVASHRSLVATATLSEMPWSSSRFALRGYVAGIAFFIASLIALMRLMVLESVSTAQENCERRRSGG